LLEPQLWVKRSDDSSYGYIRETRDCWKETVSSLTLLRETPTLGEEIPSVTVERGTRE